METPLDEHLRIVRDRRAVGDYPDLDHALAVLDGRQLEAATLVWREGLTQAQTARRMGVTQKNVHKLLAKARVNVAAALALT